MINFFAETTILNKLKNKYFAFLYKVKKSLENIDNRKEVFICTIFFCFHYGLNHNTFDGQSSYMAFVNDAIENE